MVHIQKFGGPLKNSTLSPGWQGNYDAISATLPSVRAVNAVGAVGFSQGGAVAALLDSFSFLLLA